MLHSRSTCLVGLAILGQIAAITMPSSACTGIRIKPKDGSIVYARTMEFGIDLQSNVIVLPRGLEMAGTAPGGTTGLKWTNKYGVVGMNAYGLPVVVDGLNQKGLAMGLFYFPGYAKFQSVSESEACRALAPQELATYLLGTCGDVAEVVEAVRRVKVGEVVFERFGFVPPVHFIAHDSSGRCVVIEYVGGELKIHDNPFGVMSNAPTFDWHVTNLRNYVNMSPRNVPTLDLDGEAFAPFGQGSGMLGLPGDFTPPSRFVRAVAFTRSAAPVSTALEGVQQAFHILNQFDIPKGALRESDHGKDILESTIWTTAADMNNLCYHFHTYQNRQIRTVDMKKLDLDALEIKTIPIAQEQSIEDVTSQAQPLRPR